MSSPRPEALSVASPVRTPQTPERRHRNARERNGDPTEGKPALNPNPRPATLGDVTDDVTITGSWDISKADDAKQQVFGWANVSVFKDDGEPLTDHHSHVIYPDELETAAYEFVLAYRDTGDMHGGDATGQLIESVMFTPEKLEAMGFAKDVHPTVEMDGERRPIEAAWWVGFHIQDPETYSKIRTQARRMFSIQGTAKLEEIA